MADFDVVQVHAGLRISNFVASPYPSATCISICAKWKALWRPSVASIIMNRLVLKSRFPQA